MIKERYRSLEEKFSTEEDLLKKKSTTFSVLRLVIFIFTIVIAILVSQSSMVLSGSAVIIGIGIFLFVIKRHHYLEERRDYNMNKLAVVSNELNILNRAANSYYNGVTFEDSNHSYASDLDIFGPFSIYEKINRARTFIGNQTLANYFINLPSAQDVYDRRAIIMDLEKDNGWCIEFLATLYPIEDHHDYDVAAEVRKTLNYNSSYATNTPLSIYRLSLPIIWALLISLYFFIPNWITPMAVIIALINFKITTGYANKVTQLQSRLSKAAQHLDKYIHALQIIYQRRNNYSTLIAKDKNDNTQDLVAQLERLNHLSNLLDYRLNMIPSIILNVGFLWDSKIVSKIANWTTVNAGLTDEIFHLIAKSEAIVSLALWSHNNPNFNYPNIEKDYFSFVGKDLRHPLLPLESCQPNDFSIKKSNFVSIVTGSNMSGKSTFLRTVGLNIVLGYTGARTAASELSYTLTPLISYMRIKDALEENVSTFKAELNRISMILKLLEQPEPGLVLADEMLRGTNSKDKLLGARAILIKLIMHKCYAIVATHDIGLTKLTEQFPQNINNYYFDIDYANGELVFDYILKKGICQNLNASFLLRELGIDVPDNKYVEL